MKTKHRQKNNWQTKKLWVFAFFFFLVVDIIVVLFKFPQFSKQVNLLALLATLAVLVWYTNETMLIRRESVKQTELKTMPIMVLYVRLVNGNNIDGDNYAVTSLVGDGIRPSNYYIALRNMGDGPAFDVKIESKDFKGQRYQTHFFAPKKDEHAVKIVRKPNNKIRKLEELEGEIFVISCRSVLGTKYEYRYEIKNVEKKTVEYIK